MKNSILVTIITVCYNSQNTIERTIKSVLDQTYKNIEYIIIDGKSTDNTLEIIDRCKKEFNNRLIVISEKDTGIYNAMNKGIEKANGEIIGIINSDDWYEKDAVELMVNKYIENGPAVFYGFLRFIKNNKEFMIVRTNYEFVNEQMIEHPSCFIPSCFYKNYGSFNEKYKYCADYELILRYNENKLKFIMMDSIIANFSCSGVSLTGKAKLEVLKLKYNKGYISRKGYYLELIKLLLIEYGKKVFKYKKV